MTMEDVCPYWKGLPIEILYEIFQFADRYPLQNTTFNFALVCKAWSIPAQTVLYTDVDIINLSQLRKFHNTVEHNSHLGRMVKKFNYCIYDRDVNVDKDEKLNLMTSLLTKCLPKLENFNGSILGSYVPLLNALQDSQLRHLKIINGPWYDTEKIELALYATCALFLKDRIEKIEISEEEDNPETDADKEAASCAQLYFNRLYSRLDQFDKLRSLEINKKTNDEIQEIEYILANCKSLAKLILLFDRPDGKDNTQNQTSYIEAIPTFIPAADIKELTCSVKVSTDYHLLLYVMQKFPQLQYFHLFMKYISAQLDQNILCQLLNYISKIDSSHMTDIPVNGDILLKSIGDHWKVTSRLGTECAELIYSTKFVRDYECLFDYSKYKGSEPKYTFRFPASDDHIQLINFIEENGRYLKSFEFKLESEEDSARYLLPSNFIPHTFAHCPNIQILRFRNCCFKPFTLSGLDYRKKISIQELYFYKCMIFPGILERSSLFISKIKILRIGDSIVIEPPGLKISPDDADLEIFMPHTDIDCVSIEANVDNLYLKVYSVNQEEYHYYKYQDRKLNTSNEEEYTKVNSDTHMQLCCKSNPTFKFS